MPRSFRPVAVAAVTATVVLLSVGAPSAMAAAPGNDIFSGATPASLGFSEALDTTQATTDADDAALNANCGAPNTDASVWYAYTAASDGTVVVDVSTSDYSAGVLVATGSPGTFGLVACGPGTVAFGTTAGSTYYVLAIDDQFDGGANGGTLQISINGAPSPTIAVTVNPTGTVNAKTGSATIGGTVTCANAQFVNVLTTLVQRVGVRATVSGFGGFFAPGSTCVGTPQPWTAEVVPQSGKFVGGKTASFTYSYACGALQCASGYVEQRVMLRGTK